MNRWAFTLTLLLALASPARAAGLYFVDAHSQVSESVDLEAVVRNMDANGVYRTLLAARRKGDPLDVVRLAQKYPRRIIPSVRTKGGIYRRGDPRYYASLAGQVRSGAFGAIAEVMIWHAPKLDREGQLSDDSANLYEVMPQDDRVQAALRAAISKGWPFIVHIELAGLERRRGAGERARYLAAFEKMLRSNRRHPFVMNKMGQLPAAGVRRLIERHPNLYFLTDHSTNPRQKRLSKRYPYAPPWTNAFAGKRRFKKAWARLFTEHAGRFVFALDMVRDRHWRKAFYDRSVRTYRRALAELPPKAASLIAHGNAERLWRLPPRPRSKSKSR